MYVTTEPDQTPSGGATIPFVAVPVELIPMVADGKLSVRAAWLYAILLNHINRKRRDNKVWPSRRLLAQQMRLGQSRAVDRYIEELVAVGLIDRDRRRDGEVNDTNLYTLRLVPHLGSAQKRTTPSPAETEVSPAQGVVHKKALGSAPQRTRGSAQKRTGVVHKNAPEPKEVELEEVEPPTSCAADTSAPSIPAQREEEGESKNDHEQTATEIADRYRAELSALEARRLAGPIAAALARGWTPDQIRAELDEPTTGLASVAAGLIGRARNLGDPPTVPVSTEAPFTPRGDAHEFAPDPEGRVDVCIACRYPRPNARHWTTGSPKKSRRGGFQAFQNPDPAAYDMPL